MLLPLFLATIQVAHTSTEPPADKAPSQFAFTDSRPEKERKGKALNAWMFSCNVGVIWIPDNGFGKQRIGGDRVGRLQRFLAARFGQRLNGHRLDVTSYSFVINGATNVEQYGVEVATGRFATNGYPTIKPKCSRDKMAAGWFDSSELTNTNSPIVAELKGTIDGKPFSVRSVRSPNMQLVYGISVMPYKWMDVAEFDAVLDDIGEKLSQEIDKDLF